MRHLKRVVILLLVLALGTGLLTGCSSGKGIGVQSKITVSQFSAAEVLAHVFAEEPITNEYECYMGSLVDEEVGVLDYYGFDEETKKDIKEFAIVRSLTAVANEYLVFKTEETDKTTEIVEEYRKQRINAFGGYAPDEEKKIEDSEIVSCANIVALCIGEDSTKIRNLLKEIMTANPKEYTASIDEIKILEDLSLKATENYLDELARVEKEKEEARKVDWNNIDTFPKGPRAGTKLDKDGNVLCQEIPKYMIPYDTSNIVEAYKKNDSSILTNDNDKAVLEKVKEVMNDVIKNDMTMVQKEKAIHDYIVNSCHYDQVALLYDGWYVEYTDQPYGVLVMNRSVCYGYATTFKMFMDILDIECELVTGNAYGGMHGWNLVKLDDGAWYAVDVTWDDPSGDLDLLLYTYFNVTDDILLNSKHQWEVGIYPQATGGMYSQVNWDDF